MKNEIRPDYNEIYLFPPAVEDWLPKDHPARFIRAMVDSLDPEALGFKTREVEVGAPSYSVDLLLKVWLYGFMTGIRSTRRLERACMEIVPLIWLTGRNAPDHNTLWRFYRNNRNAFKSLFRQTVKVAMKSGLVGLALHAVDGTKIRSAASGSKGVHRKNLEELLRRLEESEDEMFREVEKNEAAESGESRLPEELQDPVVLDRRIREALSEMDEAETDHLNPNDPEARMMKADRRSEFSYNAQAVVDSESGLIVAEEVVNDETDNHVLNDMLDEVEENVGEAADETVADAGYYSGEELKHAEDKERAVLVNMKSMSGGDGDGEFHASKFTYDPKRNCVICPLGEKLDFKGTSESRRGDPIKIFRCVKTNCPSRESCTRRKTGREIKIGKYHESMVRQREKQRSPLNRHLLSTRKAIVESVFGVIKEIMGFRRWSVVGLENVRALWSLICTAFNLKKLYKYWAGERLILEPCP